MPTQQDLQRRKITKTDAQFAASNKAAGTSAVSKIMMKQSNMTSNPISAHLDNAAKTLDASKSARTTNAVSFVKQHQLTGNTINSAATQHTLATAAQTALNSAQQQLATLQSQAASLQAHVNNLMATAPNSPQLAAAQAQLAALQNSTQAAIANVATAQANVNANQVNANTPQQNAVNAQYTMQDILQRIKNNQDVSTAELAYVVGKESNVLYAWMMLNNPTNVNNTMKYILGNKSLPFAPNTKQMHALVKLWLANKNTGNLNAINKNFVYNPNANNWTTNPELVAYLKTYLHI